MRLKTHRIEYRCNQTFTLYPLGDVHLGSANCDVHAFDQTLAEIRDDPHALWVGMGDMVESIAANDKRWTAGGIDENIVNLASQDRIGDVYVAKLAAKLKPIADKLVVYGDGNHEWAFDKHYYTNLSVRVLDAIGRSDAYGEWESLTRLEFSDGGHRHPLVIFASHGWQAGRMDGAKMNEVSRIMSYVDADIYLQGHSHSKFAVAKTRIEANQPWTKLVARKVYVAHTGSYLRTLQQNVVGYAERFGYPPTSIGGVKFLIKPHPNTGLDIEAVT